MRRSVWRHQGGGR